MEIPENVLRIVEEMAAKYPADIPKAIERAEKDIRSLPEFDELVSMLVRNTVQELVYDARHRANTRMRREAGDYGGQAKVVSGNSACLGRVCVSVYSYHIAGTKLGLVKGADLEAIAESERAIASGHLFNVRLCSKLKGLVPADKCVQEVVSEKKLRALFKSCSREEDDGDWLGEAARRN